MRQFYTRGPGRFDPLSRYTVPHPIDAMQVLEEPGGCTHQIRIGNAVSASVKGFCGINQLHLVDAIPGYQKKNGKSAALQL